MKVTRGTFNTKRWSLLALLLGVYVLANSLTWMSERFLLSRIPTETGPTKITQRHFRQPEEWGISPRSLPLFLDRITRERPGLLGSQWLYEWLLGAYLLLAVLVFLQLTQDEARSAEPTGSGRPGGLGVDFFLRYAQIVKNLELSLQEDSRILEIGSGAVGLAQFFADREVVGVDEKEFAVDAASANLTMIRASATQLPFADTSFDYIVCVDTLEHVPPSQRADVIKEALRVTRNKLLMAMPTGRSVERVEKILYFILAPFYWLFRKDLSFLGEHVQNGLPTQESVICAIKACSPGAEIQVQGNMHLGVWVLSMFFDPAVRFITRRAGSRWLRAILHPLAPFLNFAPAYRTTFIISKRGQGKA